MFDERPSVLTKRAPNFQPIHLPTHFPVPMPIPQPPPRRAWNLVDILLITFGCVACLIFGLTVVQNFSEDVMDVQNTPDVSWVADATAYTFIYISVFVVGIVIALLRGRTFQDMGFRRTSAGWLAAAVGLGVIFLPIRLVLVGFIILIFGGQMDMFADDTTSTSDEISLWYLLGIVEIFLLIGVLAPLVEEFIFRGILHSWLGQKIPALFAIAITGFLFGLAHQETYIIISNTVLGWVLSASYHYSQSIWVSMLAHFVNNGIVILVVLFLVFILVLAAV